MMGRYRTIGAVLFCLAMGSAEADSAYDWRSVPFGGTGFVDGFVYHPKEQGLLYARTDVGGLYRFDRAASRWLPLIDHLGRDDADLMGVLSLAIDPNDPMKLYAACGQYLSEWARKGAILRSNDQGRTWAKSELPIRVGGNADGRGSGERLAVDPRDGTVLYYGSNQDGLWRSRDGGANFSKLGTPARAISLVLIDPKTGAIFIGSADGKGALLVSHNGGEDFERVKNTPDAVPQHASFAPDGSLYVAFALSDGQGIANPSHAVGGAVFKRDAAGHWADVSPARPDGKMTFGFSGVDVGPDGTVAVSTLNRWAAGNDIFVSQDGGTHWKALSATARHDIAASPWLTDYTHGEDKMGHWIADLKINPFDPDEMIYGTGYGLWMSRNLREGKPVVFDFTVANLEEGVATQLAVPGFGAEVMASFADVGGAAWYDANKPPEVGLFRPMTESNMGVDYAGLAPRLLARIAVSHGYFSEDGGRNWTTLASSPYRAPASGEDWRGPGAIALSAKGTSMLWAPEKSAAVFSTDKGKSWHTSAGWPGGDRKLVPVSDKTIDGVYYVFDPAAGSILISVNAGASFTPIVNGMPKAQPWERTQLAVVPGRIRDLWLATPISLIHSKDSASTVVDMKTVDAAWALGFGAPKTAGAYPAIYLWGKVSKQEGLWRSDDEGASWVRINDNAHQFGSIQAISGDMRRFGTIYITPHGRGLMVGQPQH